MNGKLIFATIPKLAPNWWTLPPQNDPAIVWTAWEKDHYYTWGANKSNYQPKPIGTDLLGGGMAGDKGPTRGHAHPHYIGINTMEIQFMADNDTVFADLTQKIANGKNVIIPIFDEDKATPPTYKYSLGTGLGAHVYQWEGIQKYVLNLIVQLASTASAVDIPAGVYWPDCRQSPQVRYPIKDLADIQYIVDAVL